MDRRQWAIVAAVVVAAVVAVLFVFYPAFYLPFFFLFIPIGFFGGRSSKQDPVSDDVGGYCPECGNRVDPGDSFCPVCGAMLRRRSSPSIIFHFYLMKYKLSFFIDKLGFIIFY